MGKISRAAAAAFVLIFVLPLGTRAAELIPVGKVIGLQLKSDTVTVVAYDENLGQAARSAGMKIGDEIVSIDGRGVDSTEDVRAALEGGKTVTVTVRRNGKLSDLRLSALETAEGPRLGVYLRQGIGGIGTVTFFDPETKVFGTLGHGVCDGKGRLLNMKEGFAYEGVIQDVKKGVAGEPGQLRGSAEGPALGLLTKNTPQGLFGIARQGWQGEPVSTAAYEDIALGHASIRSTVQGTEPRDYSVELVKIYPQGRSDGRNFLIRVTDERLLEATGGIVQGMSGSPIIQDGRLIGAVTHVLVNEPTLGYGIYIGNMLDAAA